MEEHSAHLIDEPIEEIMSNILPKVRVDLHEICKENGVQIEQKSDVPEEIQNIDVIDTGYLNRIKALTDHIQKSQCEELERFNKLLTQDLTASDGPDSDLENFANRHCNSTPKLHTPASLPKHSRSTSSRIDELYNQHFENEKRKQFMINQKQIRHKKQQNKSKVGRYSKRIIQRKEKHNLHSAYKEALSLSGILDKKALEYLLRELGMLSGRQRDSKEQKMCNTLWDILAKGEEEVPYLELQKYLSLIMDPRSSTKRLKRLSQDIEDFDERFLNISKPLIQTLSTSRLMRPVGKRFTPGAQDCIEREKQEQTFRPKINRRYEETSDSESRYKSLYLDHNRVLMKQKYLKEQKENELLREELRECTFQPQIGHNTGAHSGEDVFDMLHTSALASKKLESDPGCHKTEDLEFQIHCTFQPNIRKKTTKYVQANPLQITGYDDHVKKSRAVRKEKERKKNFLSKKIESYSAKYDKRMARRKNMLLATSYADIHKKNLMKEESKPEFDEADVIYVNVAISPTKTSRITLRRGDEAPRIAREFARAWNLSELKRHRLEHTLAIQIEKLNKRNSETSGRTLHETDSLSSISSVESAEFI